MIYFYINIFFLSFIYSQSYINPNVYGSDLLDYLEDNYKTTSTLGYTNCRDLMYSEIDIKNNNQLSCVYSGYTITLDLSQDPSTNAFEQGINCEHTWPQSLGAGSEPMKSDMHHLFPTKSNVNSSRGNDPFDEINDQDRLAAINGSEAAASRLLERLAVFGETAGIVGALPVALKALASSDVPKSLTVTILPER